MRVSRGLVVGVVAIAIVGSACSGDDDSSSSANSRPPTGNDATTSSRPAATGTTTPAEPDLANVRVKLTEVASGLDLPVAFATREGDDGFYVNEQHEGRVRRIVDGNVEAQPVLDIGGEVSTATEQGLLGLTFSPDGSLLYINYTDNEGDTQIEEFAMNGNVADESTRRTVLTVDQPFANHNGGNVVFGPDDMLYIGMGDGGSAGDPQDNAENRNALLGKMLRIDPRRRGNAAYTVPGDNPFVDDANARPEVWMYGLRNPWRYSFDRATGDLWIADVGQNAWEEVDFAPAGENGQNWGWDTREGAHDYEPPAPPGVVEPIFETSHQDGNCSITGGFVYRGEAVAELRGAYLFTDVCNGDIVALSQRDGALVDNRSLGINASQVSTFGEDERGELYVVSLDQGTVSRIDPA
jgi:glucose/arabinose dehydrogenase